MKRVGLSVSVLAAAVRTVLGLTSVGSPAGTWQANVIEVQGSPSLTNGLVLYYPFNANEGSAVTDQSGKGNHGTAYGAVWTENGVSGGACQFDGVNDYVAVPDNPQLDLDTGAFTLATWVRVDRTAPHTFIGILGKRYQGFTGGGYRIDVSTDAGNFGGLVENTAHGYVVVRAEDTCSLGTWYDVVLVYSGGHVSIYQDGICLGVSAATLNGSIANADPFELGRIDKGTGAPIYLQGALDDVRVYDRALSAPEIEKLYEETVPGGSLMARFLAEPRSGLEPMEVTFTDISIGDITNRVWDFNGDRAGDATNPAAPIRWTYQSPGLYTVRLTVSGLEGSDTMVRSDYIACGVPSTGFSGLGSGTLADPYQIANVVQLQEMANNLGAYYVLVSDIDASGTVNWNGGEGFDPIGKWESDDWGGFQGTLDGQGHVINCLYINRPGVVDRAVTGLFGFALHATVRNLGLANVNITGYGHTGALAGIFSDKFSYSTKISQIYATGIVRSSNGAVGGLFGGFYDCKAWDCHSSVDVICASDYAGGLVGNIAYSDMNNCYMAGNVAASNDWAGGLVGSVWATASVPVHLNGCFAAGAVTCPGSRVGGAVGGVPYPGGTPYLSLPNSYYTDGAHQNGWGTYEPSGPSAFWGRQHAVCLNWDFNNVWREVPASYPLLEWEVFSEPPVAAFAGTPISGHAPLTVTFTDNSSGDITDRIWDFDGDGTPDATNPAAPIRYTYQAPGDYAVGVTVRKLCVEDSLLRTDYIHVLAGTVSYTVGGNPAEYGAPQPYGYGVQQLAIGTVVTNTVASPVAGASGTRYVCGGWTGSGSVLGGTGTSAVVTVQTNSTLTWQWVTEHYLDTSAGAGGSVSAGDGWYLSGTPVDVLATAEEGYHLLTWNGDVPAGHETDNPLSITMDGPRSVTAVFATNVGGRVESVIAATSDDAEEWYDGTVQLVSADLELIHNVKPEKLDQTVGLRFTNLQIPPGSVIRSAYIQFTARQDESDACTLTVRVERADSAAGFVDTARNISSRPVSTAAAVWAPSGWLGDEAGTRQRTPDLKDMVQEVVARAGWGSGNAMAFIITGQGTRTAMSYDGDAERAPVLHVVWGWSTQTAPEVANGLPSGLWAQSATLTGDLLSSGGATTAAWVYWGTADGGTNKASWSNSVGLGLVEEGVFEATVTGLTPNTVYYYRAYALNSVGEAWAGESAQFATLSGGDVTNGLVLHWKFDEGGGTTAVDSSGHGNTGTVVNATAGDWVAGRFGSALSFSGASRYVFNTNLTSALAGDLTLSCWVLSHSPAGLALDLVSGAGAEWQMCEDGALGRPGWAGTGGPSAALYAPWSIHLDGKWHHVAFVREGTTYRLYVDDRFVGSCAGTLIGYSALFAGRNTAGAGWQGEIDDVRVYNRALSWGEVGSLQTGEGLGPLDADGDGMADVWETECFGGTNAVDGAADYDKDGDGLRNRAEYVLGTDPRVKSSCFNVLITLSGGNVIVSYPTIEASGAAYEGMTRRYDLQSRGSLTGAGWQGVAGAMNVTGNNAPAVYTNTLPDATRAFRVKARLE